LRDQFPQSYWRAFEAAFDAALGVLAEMPDAELERLSRYSGIVGLASEFARDKRAREGRHRAADSG
jgi:hypothetical protein